MQWRRQSRYPLPDRLVSQVIQLLMQDETRWECLLAMQAYEHHPPSEESQVTVFSEKLCWCASGTFYIGARTRRVEAIHAAKDLHEENGKLHAKIQTVPGSAWFDHIIT